MSKINTIYKIFLSGEFEPYIRRIRFPKYKNLKKDLYLDFTFPLTAIVGANGTNKSSILKALYGAPEGYSVGNYWFSTSIDPIEEGDGEKSCLIYKYFNLEAGFEVEVLKSRVLRSGDPDYWESYAPQVLYNMSPMPKLLGEPKGRSLTRWNMIKKNVSYIDFRSALSAFDKFFYHTEMDVSNKDKKVFLRKRTEKLKEALDNKSESYIWYQERVINKENKVLGAPATSAVSQILGKEYSTITLIRHSFYTKDAYTCLMKTSSLSYSEAFAGSGEFSVVNLVTKILSSESNSLILLDEPEVSLHPGAQIRLMDFILDQIIQNKHQIILCTHSPYIIQNLPPEAIKVLSESTDESKIFVEKQSSFPEEAFYYLGAINKDKKTILVEDELVEILIKKALSKEGEAIFNSFDVKYIGGGAAHLWNSTSIFSSEDRKKLLIIFDGDQFFEQIPNQTEIPLSRNNELDKIIKSFTGVDISFNTNGNKGKGDNNHKIKLQRQFMDWSHKHVRYLPGNCTPEKLIWDNMTDKNHTNDINCTDYKERFKRLTEKELGLPKFNPPTATKILATIERRIATIDIDGDLFKQINSTLKEFI